MMQSRSRAAVLESIGPVVICLAAILLTTLVLATIDSYLPNEHLMLGYLLPTIFVAIYFGSTIAVLTSFASGFAAAYFLLPPRFSLQIADPVHIAELGFTIVLAVIASKVIGALAHDVRAQAGAGRVDEIAE
jgi:K+-sensing histidine kinase KdpD